MLKSSRSQIGVCLLVCNWQKMLDEMMKSRAEDADEVQATKGNSFVDLVYPAASFELAP